MDSKAPRAILPKAEVGSDSSSSNFDSIPPGGEPPAKRRVISSACMPCRKRKSKCDGEQPTCNSCKNVYSTQCHYDLDADHRRKGALKRDIASLTAEKNILGSIIESIKKGSEADVDDIVQLIRSSDPELGYEALALNVRKMSLHKNLQSSEAPTSLEGEFVSDFALKPSLGKTGECRHYGLTSNFSLQDPDEDRLEAVPADQVGAWTNVTTDIDLVNHLLDVYFTWSHPWYLLFSEEIFFHGMRDRKAKYCTPLLINAILAVGCHYSDRTEARADPKDPYTVGDHFFAEAQRLLAKDDNQPSLTVVQALGLMSLRQAMSNHDSSGRRYIAQMMSMAIELGLHISQGIQPSSKITASEIEARRLTFWGCFVLETAWAICIGRISQLPRTAIRLEKHALIPMLENTPWKPHGTPNYNGGSSHLEQPSLKYSILLQCSLLSEIVDEIIHLFYAPRDRITSRRLQLHHEKLQLWYLQLPGSLRIRENGPTLPQVITLHIYYHNCVIHLFRPFLKVCFVQSSKAPRQLCTEAANSISQLIGLYSRTYGLRRTFFISTHCLMTAAIIHLVNISTHPSTANNPQTQTYLADAIRGLHDMKGSCIIVGRFLNIIQNLVYKWCQDIPASVKQAMDETSLSSPPSATSLSPANPPASVAYDQNIRHSTNIVDEAKFSDRKHSAPEVLPMGPNNAKDTIATQQQELFWSPFDHTLEGVPLALPQQNNHLNQHMDITNVLDSGVDGDWPQWNRDGFTMGAEDDGPFWGDSWDSNFSGHGVVDGFK